MRSFSEIFFAMCPASATRSLYVRGWRKWLNSSGKGSPEYGLLSEAMGCASIVYTNTNTMSAPHFSARSWVALTFPSKTGQVKEPNSMKTGRPCDNIDDSVCGIPARSDSVKSLIWSPVFNVNPSSRQFLKHAGIFIRTLLDGLGKASGNPKQFGAKALERAATAANTRKERAMNLVYRTAQHKIRGSF